MIDPPLDEQGKPEIMPAAVRGALEARHRGEATNSIESIVTLVNVPLQSQPLEEPRHRSLPEFEWSSEKNMEGSFLHWKPRRPSQRKNGQNGQRGRRLNPLEKEYSQEEWTLYTDQVILGDILIMRTHGQPMLSESEKGLLQKND